MDFPDFFGDDFVQGDSMNEDSFGDGLEEEMDEPFTDELDHEDEPDRTESQDDKFTAKDAFILGGTLGFAYKQGLIERKRRKRKRFSNDSD